MAATTTVRETVYRGPVSNNVTLKAQAGVVYPKGWLVGVDANGRAALIVPDGGLDVMGVTTQTFDNTDGADDAIDVQLKAGQFEVLYDGAAPIPGAPVYALDNQTVSLDAGSPPAAGRGGIVTEVTSPTKCTVLVGPVVIGALEGL